MLFQAAKIRRALVLCLLAFFLAGTGSAFAFDKKFAYALTHYIMAGMYDSFGQVDKAIQEYKLTLRAEKESAVVHLNLASGYIRNNETENAIKELNLAAGLDPAAIEPHAILALLYTSLDKVDLATSEYQIALENASKLHPKDIEIYQSLAAVYMQQKKFKEAEAAYRLILELSPDNAEAHFYLANVYHETANYPSAVKEAKKAIELKADYHEALNFLGYLYADEGKNLSQAEAMIRKALEFEPENGAYIDSLGWLYFKKEKYQEAVKELERAVSLIQDPVVYDHLGDAYLKINDPEKAKINWEKSLALDAEQPKVRKKLEEYK
ncbi:MAG: tetratricopeptide repeat protein [Candidatus Omnitrophota bacterium]